MTLSRFMSSLFGTWRASRYSRLATFTIFISVALVLSSSELANVRIRRLRAQSFFLVCRVARKVFRFAHLSF